jgi:hypothetical protein
VLKRQQQEADGVRCEWILMDTSLNPDDDFSFLLPHYFTDYYLPFPPLLPHSLTHSYLHKKFAMRTTEETTPLCAKISAIVRKIESAKEALLERTRIAMVVIYSNARADDGDVIDALRPLKSLPVKLAIRLCADQSQLTDYWVDVQNQLKFADSKFEIIADYERESLAMSVNNSWLTYAEPLQRIREFGLPTAYAKAFGGGSGSDRNGDSGGDSGGNGGGGVKLVPEASMVALCQMVYGRDLLPG